MGIGKAAVYKHIPDYFPHDVGVVGGIVGVLGGLGGFVCPIIFGYLLRGTGIWTTCWMFFALLAAACLFWMHLVVQRMMREKAPTLMRQMDDRSAHADVSLREYQPVGLEDGDGSADGNGGFVHRTPDTELTESRKD